MKNTLTKKLLALVLAVLLIVGTIPVFAAGEDVIPTVVVKVGYTGTEGAELNYASDLGTDGEAFYPTYSTVTNAIDSFEGKEGKIWILGTFEGSGPSLEGTIANREHITFAGFNDDATKGTIKFNKTTGGSTHAENRDHRKGDVTFEKITLTSTNQGNDIGPMVAIGSGGYEVTIGEGVVSPNVKDLAIGGSANSAKDQKINIYSGQFSHVAAIAMNTATNKTPAFNAEYNIYGGSVAICAGTGYNNGQTLTPGYNTLNGDYKVNVIDGAVRTISLLALTQKTDILVTGDTIYNIKGGDVTGRVCFGNNQPKKYTLAQFAGYTAPTNRGNMAVIIDVSKITSSNGVKADVIGYNHGESEETLFQQAEGKRAIGIINNAEKSNYGFNTADYVNTTTSCLYRLHYKLTVIGGEAYPVFERENPSDPATSYLKGFTIETAEEGKVPAVNGKAVPVVEGYTYEGKTVYDLTAYMSDGKAYKDGLPNDDKTITNITFIEKEEEDTTDWSAFSAYRNDFNNSLKKLNTENETVTVVYIGGSVTQGDGIDKNIDTCWKDLTTGWLEDSFPSTIKPVNAAISGTGTTLGYYRNYNDVISKNPDLLFIEFSVNDSYDGLSYQEAAAQLETMIREIKLAIPDCDIAIVLVTDRGKVMDAKNGILHEEARAHDMVAEYYGIPAIYAGKALASKFESGLSDDALVTAWKEYVTDYVHPNGEGYKIYFNAVKGFLETVYSGDYTATNKNIDVTDASTFVSDYLVDGNRTLIGYNQTVTYENSHLAPVITDKGLKDLTITGFQKLTTDKNFGGNNTYNGHLVLDRDVEGTITFAFTGTEFTILSTVPLNSYIYCSIDGGEEQLIQVTSRAKQILTDLDPGEHTVTLRFDWDQIVVTDSTTKFYFFAIGTRDASKATGFIRTEVIEELDAYKRGEATPEKNGYLFAGWYASTDAEKAMNATEFANAVNAVAKFIPKGVLGVAWQIAKGEGDTVDLRLISSVDSLEYSAVLFTLVCGEKRIDMRSTTVYESIKGNVNGQVVVYDDPTIFSITSQYFMTHIVTGIPESVHDDVIKVTASLVTKNGTVIDGGEQEIIIENATDYNDIMGK